MTEFYFTIPGPPVGKARPRVARSGSRCRLCGQPTGKPHGYTPDKTKTYEEKVRVLALKARKGRQLIREGPVVVHVVFIVPLPPSATHTRERIDLTGSAAFVGRPDVDNVAKAVMDALNGVLYRDDSQVSSLLVVRRRGPVAKTEVSVRSSL